MSSKVKRCTVYTNAIPADCRPDKKIVCTVKHLTKFGHVNMFCVIQNVVKTLKMFYAPLVMVSH
jgi:hypothetical protein